MTKNTLKDVCQYVLDNFGAINNSVYVVPCTEMVHRGDTSLYRRVGKNNAIFFEVLCKFLENSNEDTEKVATLKKKYINEQ